MLGLLAHGLHLALVLGAMAGVAALLLPELREAHGSRDQAFRPVVGAGERPERPGPVL